MFEFVCIQVTNVCETVCLTVSWPLWSAGSEHGCPSCPWSSRVSPRGRRQLQLPPSSLWAGLWLSWLNRRKRGKQLYWQTHTELSYVPFYCTTRQSKTFYRDTVELTESRRFHTFSFSLLVALCSLSSMISRVHIPFLILLLYVHKCMCALTYKASVYTPSHIISSLFPKERQMDRLKTSENWL